MIADRPDAAYEICTKYAPDCSGGAGSSSRVVEGSTRTSGSRIEIDSRARDEENRRQEEENRRRQEETRRQQEENRRREEESRRRNEENARRLEESRKLNEEKLRQQNEANLQQRGGASSVSTARNQSGRTNSRDRSTIRNIGISSSNVNSDTEVMSRDISSESDSLGIGLGLGFNGEDDYYDSLASGDENESINRPNKNRTSRPNTPVYNPDSGFDNRERGYETSDMENEEVNRNGLSSENSSLSTSTSNFTTIINGVKIKSLPGPRGTSGLKGQKGEQGDMGDLGRNGLAGMNGPPGAPGHVFMVPVSFIQTLIFRNKTEQF